MLNSPVGAVRALPLQHEELRDASSKRVLAFALLPAAFSEPFSFTSPYQPFLYTTPPPKIFHFLVN